MKIKINTWENLRRKHGKWINPINTELFTVKSMDEMRVRLPFSLLSNGSGTNDNERWWWCWLVLMAIQVKLFVTFIACCCSWIDASSSYSTHTFILYMYHFDEVLTPFLTIRRISMEQFWNAIKTHLNTWITCGRHYDW